MNIRFVFGCLLAIAVVGPALADAFKRPNIVVLLCDDLGYGDLGCYGHPHIQTPHLDRLASNGIRFTDMYSAAPVCSPSRVGLLTGRSPNRAGVYDWIPEVGQRGSVGRSMVHMRASETTIPSLLNKAGYQTCMAGKWHCNSHFNSDVQPQPGDFGFDHWLATQNNAAPSHENPRNFVRNGQAIGRVERFSCQFVIDEALTWLQSTDRDAPFFLYVPFHEPHEPVASPETLVSKYRDVARDEDEAQYFANVANVDDAVGRLIDGLERMNVRDNTLVIFTSDNGPETHNRYASANRSYGRPGKLRGMKLHTTEAGFRVVGIANWPAKISANQTVAMPISSLDFLPTFCQLADCPSPSQERLDGINIEPVLTGSPSNQVTVERDRPLVWAYYNATNEARVAMRSGKWKVLAKLDNGKLAKLQNVTSKNVDLVQAATLTDIEIYDLDSDVSETIDVAGHSDVPTESLTSELENAYQQLLSDSHVWSSGK
ncbi:sulfatase-like hydrolase/transferase [Rubripirellula amarantea]|nr:sulfatase-like hydrolase/transferase [Rubripirellula amarantea]